MKSIILFAIALLLSSCAKDRGPESPSCQTDGKGIFKIYNGIHVPIDVSVFPNNGGPWSTANGTLFLKTLATGEKWELEVPVGEYQITAHGEEPGPYAHNSFDFGELYTADDCTPVKVDY